MQIGSLGHTIADLGVAATFGVGLCLLSNTKSNNFQTFLSDYPNVKKSNFSNIVIAMIDLNQNKHLESLLQTLEEFLELSQLISSNNGNSYGNDFKLNRLSTDIIRKCKVICDEAKHSRDDDVLTALAYFEVDYEPLIKIYCDNIIKNMLMTI